MYAAYLSLLRVINADDSSRHSHAHARPASAPPSQAVPAHSGKSGAPSPDSEGAELAAATVALSPPAYPSHNVLLTPRWLAVFPRARSAWAGVAVNSVGFAGLLLTRADGVEALKSATPLGVLRACVLDLQPDI